jgi:circadian clock protein KaiC
VTQKPKREKVHIRLLSTGIPSLDTVLGGGLPAYSVNLVAGPPGSGKTTLVQQIIFHNATPERKALVLAVLSEPLVKMLRYQQQFDFFDLDKVDSAVAFFDLGRVAREEGLKRTLEVIKEQMDRVQPSFLAIDSFKALEELSRRDPDHDARSFTHDLSTYLAGWQCTSFLVGEYYEQEVMGAPESSAADGIFWMSQEAQQNSVVRKLQVIKCRGQETAPGRHTFRISDSGILLFPRAMPIPERPA